MTDCTDLHVHSIYLVIYSVSSHLISITAYTSYLWAVILQYLIFFQQLIPLGTEPPQGFERLDDGEELVFPRSWLCLLLSKCKGKGPALTFKKMMDGFFEPEELLSLKAVEFASSNRIMKAIKSKL